MICLTALQAEEEHPKNRDRWANSKQRTTPGIQVSLELEKASVPMWAGRVVGLIDALDAAAANWRGRGDRPERRSSSSGASQTTAEAPSRQALCTARPFAVQRCIPGGRGRASVVLGHQWKRSTCRRCITVQASGGVWRWTVRTDDCGSR